MQKQPTWFHLSYLVWKRSLALDFSAHFGTQARVRNYSIYMKESQFKTLYSLFRFSLTEKNFRKTNNEVKKIVVFKDYKKKKETEMWALQRERAKFPQLRSSPE